MNKLLQLATILAGFAVIGWVGAGYLAASPLALAVTVLIGAFYAMGVLELHRFRQATATLAAAVDALTEPPASLRAWLAQVPAALQNAVRRRIEGEPVGLPGPGLAPTLAGLLVLLGMLGTFLGMVLTLRGTGAALEGATDLLAIRNSLVAPVKGLGLAFGTSVAGVAASAALGLLSALCRRERAAVAQQLDARIATSLRVFSVAHQREASLALAERQAEAMPALVDGLRAMMASMERQAEASNQRLLSSQERFHDQTATTYAKLAASVEQTLQASAANAARLAGETIHAAAAATLGGIARETATLHAAFAETMQAQLDGLSGRVEAQTLAQQQRVCDMLERSARDTGAEIARLLQTAAEAPRAAAEVLAELRQRLSDSMARDNGLLDERARILGTLDELLGSATRSAAEQRGAIDALLASSAAMLASVGERFGEQVEAEAGRLAEVTAQVSGSAVEVASLGEAFGSAVQQFGASNDKLGAHLERIDGALGAAMSRSDEQLAYYVAQAREVIDLSILSQRQIIEDLQRLAARPAPAEALAP